MSRTREGLLRRAIDAGVGLLFVALVLSTRMALADVDAVAPPGGGLSALGVRVDLAAGALRYRSCATVPCAPDAGSPRLPIAIDRALLPAPRDVVVEVVPVGDGRRVVHVRVPTATGVAWEAILAAGSAPIFAGATGFLHGEEGERSGPIVQILPREGETKFVLVGEAHEDVRICGQEATPLTPRVLDPTTMALRGASVQRLSREQRDGATRVIASARGGPAEAPLAPLLLAVGASSGATSAKGMTDGDPATTWSEGRPGHGQGEFVVMRAPHEVPLTRFAIVIAPPATNAAAIAPPVAGAPPPAASSAGAAPRTFFLVTDTSTVAVTMPEDAWMHPGAAYDVPLADAVQTSCLALVLDEAYSQDRARPDVTVAELYAYSAFDAAGATFDRVAVALGGGGARAEAAAGVLKRGGAPGLAAVLVAYDKLDAPGRALAIDVAASSPSCGSSAPLLVRAMADRDLEVRRKGRGKLERCGRAAIPALIDALRDVDRRRDVAPLLASIAREASLEPLAGAMGEGPPETRAAVRSAYAHAAESAPAGAVAALLSDAHRAPEARLDLVRASSAALSGASGPAYAAILDLMRDAPPMRTRYLLLAPLGTLARAGNAEATARFVELLSRDPDGPVRARAADLAGGIAAAEAPLGLAVRDPEPRVREAALHTMASARLASLRDAAKEALARDAWTFVRSAAATALAGLPPSPEVDLALGGALRDASSRVRAAAVLALSSRGAVAFRDGIRARLDDEREDLDVRIASATALGALCDKRALDRLSELARRAAPKDSNETDTMLGLAAADALGALHPADLGSRLAKLRDASARPEARASAERAMAEAGRCK